jgi:hypothetical protein
VKLEEMRAKNAAAEEYIKLAAEYGVTISKEDYEQAMKQAMNRNENKELNEEELDDVSGGFWGNDPSCFFVYDSSVPLLNNGSFLRAKCKARSCYMPFVYCNCHGNHARCEDGWHRLDTQGVPPGGTAYPWPANAAKHVQTWAGVRLPE